MIKRIQRVLLLSGILLFAGWLGPARAAQAELVMKLLAVNPSDTEPKEFDIRSPLPPEVKPEHVLDADGLKVDYDSQAGVYVLVGKVTLKPKESITKRIVLEDVWVIPAEEFSSIRREMEEVLRKLDGTPYEEQGKLLAKSIERRLGEVEESQDEPFTNPMQHINKYRENLKTLDIIRADLTSLHQLMVLAAIQPQAKPSEPVSSDTGKQPPVPGAASKENGLSMQTTWWLIFGILGVLGCVSILFFLIWHRQLRMQMNKQAARESGMKAQAANADALNLPPPASSGEPPKA